MSLQRNEQIFCMTQVPPCLKSRKRQFETYGIDYLSFKQASVPRTGFSGKQVTSRSECFLQVTCRE